MIKKLLVRSLVKPIQNLWTLRYITKNTWVVRQDCKRVVRLIDSGISIDKVVDLFNAERRDDIEAYTAKDIMFYYKLGKRSIFEHILFEKYINQSIQETGNLNA